MVHRSEELKPVSNNDLEAYLRKREEKKKKTSTVTRFYKPPGACTLLLILSQEIYEIYARRVIAENAAKERRVQRYTIDAVADLGEALKKLVETSGTKKIYDAVIIPQNACLATPEATVSGLEFVMSIKRYKTAQASYEKKKQAIKEHIPGKDLYERDFEFHNIRQEYSEVPFVFLYNVQSEKEIQQIIALQIRHSSETRLQTIHFFEVTPTNHAELLKKLTEIIKG